MAIGAGMAARSVTLLAFGIDSVIELASACALAEAVQLVGERLEAA